MFTQLLVKIKCLLSLNGFFSVCAIAIILSPSNLSAQDKIYKTDSTIIQAKVQEIGESEIRYRKFSNLNGPVYTVRKESVWKILYENGEKEIYNSPLPVHRQVQKPAPTVHTNPINIPEDQFHNFDLILTSDGDNIICTIERVDPAKVYYVIKRRGADPKGNVSLEKVIKYKFNQQWFQGSGIGSSTLQARNFILTEDFNDAIVSYSQSIVQDSVNSALLAEDAYALALAGVYEAALIRLDRCWRLGFTSPDVNYFAGQVFALMGYDDLSTSYWKPSSKYQPPSWISANAEELLQKFNRRSKDHVKKTRDDIIADYDRANELSEQGQYFQSMVLFRKISEIYPTQYLPLVGYSIALERTGALQSAAKILVKAIAMVGDKPEDADKKKIMEVQNEAIKRKLARLTPDALPGLMQNKIPDSFRPQVMAFAGIMLAPKLFNLNFRIGYYLSGSSNASFDFGVSNSAAVTTVNLGLSGYYRQKVLVCGGGFNLNAGNSSTTVSIKISLGVSIRNKAQTSSFDIFLDGYQGLAKHSLTTIGMSIGKTLYFGKRK